MLKENNLKKQLLELQECTFKPEIKTNSEYSVSRSFFERQQNWKKTLQHKLEEKRQQKRKKQNDNLTFQPIIISNSYANSYGSQGLNYCRRSNLPKKNTYKAIHLNSKKCKEITKTVITQLFQYKRLNTDVSNTHQKLVNDKQQKSQGKNIRINPVDLKNSEEKQYYIQNSQQRKQNEKSCKNINQVNNKNNNFKSSESNNQIFIKNGKKKLASYQNS